MILEETNSTEGFYKLAVTSMGPAASTLHKSAGSDFGGNIGWLFHFGISALRSLFEG